MKFNIPISEIMTKELVYVTPAQKLIDVKHIFEMKNFHHHIPVAVEGKLKGIISLIDFLYAIKEASLDENELIYHNLLVKDIMRQNPVTRPSTTLLADILHELAKGDVHAIVIADDGELKGIVSTSDVIRYFLERIEEMKELN